MLYPLKIRLNECLYFQESTVVIELFLKVSLMGLLKKARERLRRGLPKMDFMKNKHKNCANFDNKTCKVFHFTNLDPEGQACPHFKPKTLPETEKKNKADSVNS